MKYVIAIVKPHATMKVFEKLMDVPLLGQLTCREAKGFGRQKNYLGLYRGSEYSMAYLPKTCFSFLVEKEHLGAAVEAVISAARSGRMGDGKIFVFDVDQRGHTRANPEPDREPETAPSTDP